MIENIIAQRYAQALFDLGKSIGSQEVEKYNKILLHFEEMIKKSQALKQLFSDPTITVSEKKNVLLKLLSMEDTTQPIKNFCLLLAEKGRLPLLVQIAHHFRTLLDKSKDILHGQLTTALFLDETKQSEIHTYLEKQTGKKLELIFQVNPTILGGIILQIEDKVVDASLQAQLNVLRETIMKGE